jgi:predicted ATPase
LNSQGLVAREGQLAQLEQYLKRAIAGEGQICFISGEAGSGKTALALAFAQEAQERYPDLVVVIGNCNAQIGIGDPYLPFREILAMLVGDEGAMTKRVITPENAGRIRKLISRSARVLVEVAPELIGTLIPGGLLVGALGKAIADKAGWTKKLEKLDKLDASLMAQAGLPPSRVFEQCTRFLNALAEKQPIMIVMDDLQWADAASTALLFHLSRRISDSRVLILGTYRPVQVALGEGHDQHPLAPVLTECKRYFGDAFMALDEVDEATRHAFVNALLDLEPNRLDRSFRETLLDLTAGHPLFTIELLRDMKETGDLVKDMEGRWIESAEVDWTEVPARVEGVIEKRLGRLERELREMLEVASVEGEEFTAQIVAKVNGTPDRQALGKLSCELERRHRVVRELGEEAVSGRTLSLFRFTHALFQHYIYEHLGRGERRLLHGEIATAMEELYAGQADRIAVQLAHHFEHAGLAEQATAYHFKAGQLAVAVSGLKEAIAHYTKGLSLLRQQPDTPQRAELELRFQIALGHAEMGTRGHSAPEVEEAFARAQELCEQLGDAVDRWPVLEGKFYFHLVRAEHQKAYGFAEQLLARPSESNDNTLLVLARHALGTSSYLRGEFAEALDHFERGVDLYLHDDRELHIALAQHSGRSDRGPASLVWLSQALLATGFPDQALVHIDRAHALAGDPPGRPYSLATVHVFAAMLHYIRRDWLSAQASSAEAVATSTEHGFQLYATAGEMFLGGALSAQGATKEGLHRIEANLSRYRMMGAKALVPYFLSLLAEAHGRAGHPDEALTVLMEALSTARDSGERFYLAELERLRGEILLTADGGTEAEAGFQKAIEVARAQGAKTYELRAVTSLSRLWQQQGRVEEARRLLHECYDWFTEGFDTPSLTGARELLSELG